MDALAQLAAIVGAGQLLTDVADLAPYLVDWRGRYRGKALCVVRPASTAEVAAVVTVCAALRLPILPQGGNTSLCGAATPGEGSLPVIVSLARLNRIREVDAANHTMTVEAGCTLAAVQEAAAYADRLFPLSLASEGSCQIGGNLSTNAGGVQVLRYGNTRELTLGLEVVLPDGSVWDGLRGLRKDNTGYDLKQLFIGAEGTLGIITAAVLKLFPLPGERTTACLGIASPAVAVELLNRCQARFGAALTAFELISDIALGLVRQHLPQARPPFAGSVPWAVLCELSGAAGEHAPAFESFLADLLEEGLLLDATLAQSEAQRRQLWFLRENISEAQKIEGFSIKHDIAVPVSRIPEFLARADALLTAAYPGLRIVAFGHVGDGNLHYNLSAPLGDSRDFLVNQSEINRRVHDLVNDLHGSISAEHGIGQLKREEILRYKSPLELDLMHRIKQVLDPLGIMNPGKLL
jgi:FAD/FMN-containing dehydrogenase